jgi:DNA-binding transcriptional ArsR family regulator
MVETFAALAEPNRLRIVGYLRGGPRAVGEISARLRLRQPQVSKHLRRLHEVGLVEVEAVAQQRVYGLRPGPFRALDAWLGDYRQLWEARFAGLDEVLEELKRRGTDRRPMKEATRHDRKQK